MVYSGFERLVEADCWLVLHWFEVHWRVLDVFHSCCAIVGSGLAAFPLINDLDSRR